MIVSDENTQLKWYQGLKKDLWLHQKDTLSEVNLAIDWFKQIFNFTFIFYLTSYIEEKIKWLDYWLNLSSTKLLSLLL